MVFFKKDEYEYQPRHIKRHFQPTQWQYNRMKKGIKRIIALAKNDEEIKKIIEELSWSQPFQNMSMSAFVAETSL